MTTARFLDVSPLKNVKVSTESAIHPGGIIAAAWFKLCFSIYSTTHLKIILSAVVKTVATSILKVDWFLFLRICTAHCFTGRNLKLTVFCHQSLVLVVYAILISVGMAFYIKDIMYGA